MASGTVEAGRISLMEMEIDAMTGGETVARIGRSLDDGRGGWVITPNLDHLRQHWRSVHLRRAFADADLVLADGMPLIWASKIQDTPLPERVAGSDLIWSLSEELGRRNGSLYLVGGNPGTAGQAGEILKRSAPGLHLAGSDCPPMGFEHDADQLERVIEAIERARPDVVYVGLPLDKQVALIPQLRDRLPNTWFLGLGISFSFVTGDVGRAPSWAQRSGFEWLHRLTQEPGRLARRYLLEGLPFAAQLFSRALTRRVTRRLRARCRASESS